MSYENTKTRCSGQGLQIRTAHHGLVRSARPQLGHGRYLEFESGVVYFQRVANPLQYGVAYNFKQPAERTLRGLPYRKVYGGVSANLHRQGAFLIAKPIRSMVKKMG